MRGLKSRSIQAATNEENEKTLRASVLIYNLAGDNTQTEWISARRVTQRQQPDFSSFGTRRSLPWGLGYVSSILWVTTRIKTQSGHISTIKMAL
jgi:hypothetical protein